MASVARNTAYLTVSKSLNVAIYAIFGLLLPEFVPLEINGVYTLMSTLLFFGGMAASFGIPLVIVRAVAQDRSRAPEMFVTARNAMLFGALVAGAAAVAYVRAESSILDLPGDGRLWLVLLVAGILLADAWAAVGESLYQAHEEMTLPALVEGAVGLFKVGGGLLCLWQLPDAQALFGVYAVFLAGSLARAAVLTPRARRRFVPGPLPPAGLARSLQLFRESLGVALFRMLRMVRNRIDIFLIGLLIPVGVAGLIDAPDLARGLYGQAMRVVLVFHTLTLAFNTAIFPGMVRAAGGLEEPAVARSRFFRAVGYQSWWAAPLAALLFVYSDDIAGWFGPEYRDGLPGLAGSTSQVLRVLVIATLLDALGGPVGMIVLGTRRLDRYLPLLGGILAGVSVALNLVLIPRYGIVGAAYASLAASATEILIKLFLIRRLLGSPAAMLPRTLPCVALAALLGWGLAAGPLSGRPILGSIGGGLAYLALTFALGLVDPAIRERLKRALRRAGS